MSKPIDPLTTETTDQAGIIRQQLARLLAILPNAKPSLRVTTAAQLQKLATSITRLADKASRTK